MVCKYAAPTRKASLFCYMAKPKQHHFDINTAIDIGLHEAIILNNFEYWIDLNRSNKKHFYDGRYWTFNSVRALSELFPYLSYKQIRTAIDKLLSLGILVKGNFNKVGYDRTTWYSITDVPICPTGQMDLSYKANGFAQEGEPIPDNNSDNFTDNEKENSYLIKNNSYLIFKEWIRVNTPRVLSLEEQVTEKEYKTLIKNYSSNDIKVALAYMHNQKDLNKKYNSVYTSLNFLLKNKKQTT